MFVSVDRLTFSYASFPVLRNCSLSIDQGEVVALVGASGSGKTTLLRLIAGLDQPQSGDVNVNVPLSYMPQGDLLLPWRTAWENVLLPLEIEGIPIENELLVQMLDQVGLKESRSLYPSELSGGMRQRIAFVRTLALKRTLILLDEPFNAVDVILREKLYQMLRDYLKERASSLLFVSHDYRDALALADRLYIMNEGCLLSPLSITQQDRNDPTALATLTQDIREKLQDSL